MRRVLVVDDEENIRLVLRTLLKKHGYETEVADSGEAALAALDSFDPDVILTDVRMPRMGGLDLLGALKAKQHPATVIVMSAYGNVDLAIEAIKAGAYDYVGKPFKPDEIVLALRKAEEREALRRENRALREQIQKDSQFESILAKSRQMLDIFRTVAKIADFKTTVLVTGESGTGKELVARAIHTRSSRKSAPFVAVNCGAIPENLLESELFGHRKGAFTGAVKQTIGKIESANRGTLFLDEIGDLPHALQVKLLRFLQDQVIERIGGRQRIQVDVRIVSATNSSLEERVNEGTFRGDPFYRMNAVTVRIPPLRGRGGDALLLANYFLARFNREFGRNIRGFTEAANAAIAAHAWPGNVRELENRMKRAVVMAERRMIDAADLELAPTAQAVVPLDLRAARLRAEREVLQLALARANGTLSVAAKLLGVSRPTLYGLMEVHGIEFEPGKVTDAGAEADESRLDME